jgi:hypothetical protein
MRTLTFRGILSWLLIMLMGTPSFAADSAAAMLYTNGTAWINGGTIPKSSAIFAGDLVETKSDSVANIKSSGTSVLVLSDSFIQYQGSAVKLEHGSMNVATSKGMAAQIGGLKVVPAAVSWTEFEVHDTDGAVRIIARKGNVKLIDANGTTSTLAEGQETTRDETTDKGKKKKDRGAGGAVPGATGGVLDSPLAIGIGIGVAGGMIGWALLKDDEPVSPKRPAP